jgi:hypothetical protein
MRPQPRPPAGWGQLPPPRPPGTSGLPWYQRWWWVVALAAFLLGAGIVGGEPANTRARSQDGHPGVGASGVDA